MDVAVDVSSCIEGQAITMTFDHWYDFESGIEGNCDGSLVQVYNGSAWVDIAPSGAYPGTIDASGWGETCSAFHGKQGYMNKSGKQTWSQASFDLTSYGGTAGFKIRFCMAADGTDGDGGWYIDNLKITATST